MSFVPLYCGLPSTGARHLIYLTISFVSDVASQERIAVQKKTDLSTVLCRASEGRTIYDEFGLVYASKLPGNSFTIS
jgi:hypothetical protein